MSLPVVPCWWCPICFCFSNYCEQPEAEGQVEGHRASWEDCGGNESSDECGGDE